MAYSLQKPLLSEIVNEYINIDITKIIGIDVSCKHLLHYVVLKVVKLFEDGTFLSFFFFLSNLYCVNIGTDLGKENVITFFIIISLVYSLLTALGPSLPFFMACCEKPSFPLMYFNTINLYFVLCSPDAWAYPYVFAFNLE